MADPQNNTCEAHEAALLQTLDRLLNKADTMRGVVTVQRDTLVGVSMGPALARNNRELLN